MLKPNFGSKVGGKILQTRWRERALVRISHGLLFRKSRQLIHVQNRSWQIEFLAEGGVFPAFLDYSAFHDPSRTVSLHNCYICNRENVEDLLCPAAKFESLLGGVAPPNTK